MLAKDNLMIHIMRVLCTGNNCVSKRQFPLTMLDTDNKGILLFIIMFGAESSEESTREEVGCAGNEDVKMDEWSHQDGQN